MEACKSLRVESSSRFLVLWRCTLLKGDEPEPTFLKERAFIFMEDGAGLFLIYGLSYDFMLLLHKLKFEFHEFYLFKFILLLF